MESKMNKKKKTAWQGYIAMVFFMLIGAACGVLMAKYFGDSVEKGGDVSVSLFQLAGLFVIMYVMIIVQTIIHEAGHMVFGMLTGYRFRSFRIFSFMWLKENGRIRLRRLVIAGTGGQCLMAPPDFVDGKIPVMLYNFGGVIFNMAAGIIFEGLYFMTSKMPLVSIVMQMGAVIGFAFAILNGIPLKMGTVDNDGHNAFALRRSRDAQYGFWLQMKVNEQTAEGIRIKDMPDQWFQVPSDEEMKNSMTAVRGVLVCSRLMDAQHFDEADQLMEHLLEIESGIVALHRHLMICDRMYIELITLNRQDVLNGMLSKEQKKLMKAMKKYPSVLRTEYAYALLAQRDTAKADKQKALFEKCAAAYPYPVEIRAEKELMDIARQKYPSMIGKGGRCSMEQGNR